MDQATLVEYVNSGYSQRKIAELINKSQSSVRYYLEKYNLKTDPHGFNRPVIPKGMKFCVTCKHTKSTVDFHYSHKEQRIRSICKRCATDSVLARQRAFKQQCLDYKGNTGCTRCGYNKTNVALEFHHRNPAEKDFSMAKFKMYKLIDIVKEELDKCDVLCSNCHKEVHHELRDCGAAASAGDF